MAEDYQDARRQFKGNILVERSRSAHGMNALKSPLASSHTTDKTGIHPASSRADNSIHSNNVHHHKRHLGHGKGKIRKSYKTNADRFSRTAAILRQAGLMKLTLQIAELIKTNEDLQKEIDELQREAMEFSENLRNQIQQKLSEQNGNY